MTAKGSRQDLQRPSRHSPLSLHLDTSRVSLILPAHFLILPCAFAAEVLSRQCVDDFAQSSWRDGGGYSVSEKAPREMHPLHRVPRSPSPAKAVEDETRRCKFLHLTAKNSKR